MANWASLVLRLGLGVMFMGHGLQKAFGVFGGPGVSNFANMLAGLGFQPPLLWAYVAAYTELIGGALLILGLGIRFAAAFLLLLITIAAIKVHVGKGFFLATGGFEYALIIACACIALMLLGAGKFGLNTKF